jgi:hypothetical protein
VRKPVFGRVLNRGSKVAPIGLDKQMLTRRLDDRQSTINTMVVSASMGGIINSRIAAERVNNGATVTRSPTHPHPHAQFHKPHTHACALATGPAYQYHRDMITQPYNVKVQG